MIVILQKSEIDKKNTQIDAFVVGVECVNGVSIDIPRCLPPLECLEGECDYFNNK